VLPGSAVYHGPMTVTKQKSVSKRPTSSVMRTSDPSKCNYPMGLNKSFQGSISKLRFCQRDRATCQFHKAKTRAN